MAVTVELKIGEGTVFGARYHTVQPMFGADYATWFRQEWQEIEDWCGESFGGDGSLWDAYHVKHHPERWYVNDSKFWFRNESDMVAFVLRWS